MRSLYISAAVIDVAPLLDDNSGSGRTPGELAGSLLVPWQWPSVVSLQHT